MNLRTRATALIVVISILVGARAGSAANPGERAPPPGNAGAAHYCNMKSFTSEGLARHKELTKKLSGAVTAVRAVEDGYVFELSGEARETGEWLDGVRGCCPTLTYDLHFERLRGSASLRLTGTAGAKEFIEEEFHRLFEKMDAGQ